MGFNSGFKGLISSFGEQCSSEHVTEQWVRSAIPLYLGGTGFSFDPDHRVCPGLGFSLFPSLHREKLLEFCINICS